MATSIVFKGVKRIIPDVYARIISGIVNPISVADYGKILIIDTGSGAGFGGGSGIAGTLVNGANAIYKNITDPDDFRTFMKGGLWWDLAEPLFRPSGSNNGVSSVEFVKAAATVPAAITYTFGAGSYPATGGIVEILLRDEGIVGNGAEVSSVLTRGVSGKMSAGVSANKYIFTFWRGTYKGLDYSGYSINGIAEADCEPELLVISPEVSNYDELVDWITNDTTFNIYFKIGDCTKVGTGDITDSDLALYLGNNLAAGGIETYNSTHLLTVLDEVKNHDYSIILCDKYGVTDARSTENLAIQAHIEDEARFDKFMVVGAGFDSSEFDQAGGSIEIATAYNSTKVVIVHGGILKTSKSSATGFRELPSIYKAALVVGRICGLEPQVPLTFKSLDYDGEIHILNDKAVEKCLTYGVLCTRYDDDFTAYTVVQDVNTIQDNENFINEDGTSFSWQIERIKSQINKEIIINAKKQLLGNPNGVNRNTLTEKDVEVWLRSYLKDRTADTLNDNLIIRSQNIVVKRKADNYYATYEFEPNGEITKMIFTGVMID